jgi:glycosyltransferase involved in cell wall biosynthesis
MKILQIHNEYLIRGGEDTILENEKIILEKKGHKVQQLIRKNKKEIKSILDWIVVLKNLSHSNKSIKILDKYFKINKLPDIVHIHNIFPLWTYSILDYFNKKKIPMVLTLHNYRLLIDKVKISNNDYEKFGLFKNSKILTFLISKIFNKNKIKLTYISKFICYTNFQKKLYAKYKINKKKIIIKENPLQLKKKYKSWDKRKDKIIFIGRLSKEKGLLTLLKAWKIWGSEAPILEIIGDGAEKKNLNSFKNKNNLNNVVFLGKLSYEKVQKKIENSKLIIVPSEWFEPFGLIITEALSKGTPVAVSNIGTLPDLIKTYKHGFYFNCNDELSLFKKVKKAWNKKGYLTKLSNNAKNTNKIFSHQKNYNHLMSIYNEIKK